MITTQLSCSFWPREMRLSSKTTAIENDAQPVFRPSFRFPSWNSWSPVTSRSLGFELQTQCADVSRKLVFCRHFLHLTQTPCVSEPLQALAYLILCAVPPFVSSQPWIFAVVSWVVHPSYRGGILRRSIAFGMSLAQSQWYRQTSDS